MKGVISAVLLVALLFISGCGAQDGAEIIKTSSKYPERISSLPSSSSEFAVDRAQINYQANRKIESSELWQEIFVTSRLDTLKEQNIIYYQNMDILKQMKYGSKRVDETGCGVIALHNALVLLGKKSDFSKLIYELESNGKLILNGALGTDPTAAEYVAQKYELSFSVFSDVNELNKLKDGQGVVVMTFWNEKGNITAGVHTVAALVNRGEIRTYNLFANDESTYSFYDFNSILEQVNGELTVAYYLK